MSGFDAHGGDRVVKLRRVRAGDLRPDPRNWRRHPPGQRAVLSPDARIPVLVVDLDHSEAGAVMATLDPLAAMAEADRDALARLLSDFDAPPSIDLREMYALALCRYV